MCIFINWLLFLEIYLKPMRLDNIFFYTGGLCLIISFFVGEERKTFSRIMLGAGFLILFAPLLFLPTSIFGKWNAIKKLQGKEITTIVLQPSLPGWEVNLTDSTVVISGKNQIDSISNLLHNTEVYFANRYSRIWETTMFLVTKENDSLLLKIEKTENETDITTPGNKFKNYTLGAYLEKLTGYKAPFLGRPK